MTKDYATARIGVFLVAIAKEGFFVERSWSSQSGEKESFFPSDDPEAHSSFKKQEWHSHLFSCLKISNKTDCGILDLTLPRHLR